jgi:diacylglycerol kinase
VVIGVVVNCCSLYLHLKASEAALILLCTGLVLSLEMINTSIEKLCDFTCKNSDPIIKQAKDVAAGAVLMASVISALIAAIVFVPKIYSLI